MKQYSLTKASLMVASLGALLIFAIIGKGAEVNVAFANAKDAPLLIKKAAIRTRPASTSGGMLNLTLTNTSNHTIKAFGIVVSRGSKQVAYAQDEDTLKPGQTITVSSVALDHSFREPRVRVAGVRFQDGSEWGAFPANPPAPPAPAAPGPPGKF